MTKGEDFTKKGKSKISHGSSMSNSAWCDLNSKGDILKLHDKCLNPKCKCQKIITFTRHQYMLGGASKKSELKSNFRGTKQAWDIFIKPGLKTATPLISAAVASKTKNPQSVQLTNKILKTLTGGKVLSLTDMHGNGLRF